MPTATADRASVELDWRLDFFDNQFWVMPRNADAIPDKRKQRVGKPVKPTQILDLMAVFEMQVHPNVKKFVDAEPGYVVGFETTGSQEFARDVVVPLELLMRQHLANARLVLPRNSRGQGLFLMCQSR